MGKKVDELDRVLYGERVLNFIFGGSAEFFIRNEKTGNTLYYHVVKATESASDTKYGKQRFFVSGKLTRQNKYYSYCGTLCVQNGTVTSYPATGEKKNIYLDTAWFMRSIYFVINRIQQGTLPSDISFSHVGRCGLCNRRLTDETSVELGFGAVCYAKLSKFGL